jgi:hypothetical protein
VLTVLLRDFKLSFYLADLILRALEDAPFLSSGLVSMSTLTTLDAELELCSLSEDGYDSDLKLSGSSIFIFSSSSSKSLKAA